MTRRSVLTALTLGLVSMAASAGARSPERPLPEPSPSGLVLEDADGNRLPIFYHEGRTFVLAEPGERYSVRVINPTGERVEAVVSVDGRDAISGRVANYRTQRGYIVPPYGSLTIDGFRQSLSAVAAFRFASPEQSYSARMGTPENVGIVGVALFSERQRQRQRRRQLRPAPVARKADSAAASRGRVDNLGTEYGETRESAVVEVPFERASSRPKRVLTLRYDDADGLSARGIELGPRWSRRLPEEPEAFPNSRFAQPPP